MANVKVTEKDGKYYKLKEDGTISHQITKIAFERVNKTISKPLSQELIITKTIDEEEVK